MSDLSNTLRNMKFMQRTSDSRKKSLKKPTSSSTPSSSLPLISTNPSIPEHVGCWRIIENLCQSSSSESSTNSHPIIITRPSVFAVHERTYSRLSFQNFNKRLEPIMMKYGLQQELKHLEDGEIDPNDDDVDDDDDDDEGKEDKDDDEEKKQNDAQPFTTLGKTIGKKFAKKSFSRIQFDSKSRVTKKGRRKRRDRTSNLQ